jgi:hypothetical protein
MEDKSARQLRLVCRIERQETRPISATLRPRMLASECCLQVKVDAPCNTPGTPVDHPELSEQFTRQLLSIRCVPTAESFNFYIAASRYPRSNAL